LLSLIYRPRIQTPSHARWALWTTAVVIQHETLTVQSWLSVSLARSKMTSSRKKLSSHQTPHMQARNSRRVRFQVTVFSCGVLQGWGDLLRLIMPRYPAFTAGHDVYAATHRYSFSTVFLTGAYLSLNALFQRQSNCSPLIERLVADVKPTTTTWESS
jgi:hypothetical protein